MPKSKIKQIIALLIEIMKDIVQPNHTTTENNTSSDDNTDNIDDVDQIINEIDNIVDDDSDDIDDDDNDNDIDDDDDDDDDDDVELGDALGDIIGGISFYVTNTGEIEANCSWLDESTSLIYGELLYKINNGDLIGVVVANLMQKANSNPVDAKTVHNILEAWRLVKEHHENQPMIQASDVFAVAEFQQGLRNGDIVEE